MAEALQAAPPDMQGVAGNDIVSSLLEVAEQAGKNIGRSRTACAAGVSAGQN
jgi:hypothetical protein